MRTLANRVIAGEFKPLTGFYTAIHHPPEHPSPLAVAIADLIPRRGLDLDLDLERATGITGSDWLPSKPTQEWITEVLAKSLANRWQGSEVEFTAIAE